MALTDTTEEARRRQLEFYAAMPGADKVLLAAEMAEQVKNIALDGIRSRDPGLPEAEIHAAWLRLLHGDLAPSLSSASTAETS